MNDNSVGGATGSGSPKPGDWFGIGSSGAEGSVDLEHVNLSYAYTGLDADGGGETVVRDDAFASQDEGAVAISGSGSAPTLEDNTSDGSGEAAGPGVPAYIVHGELNADLLGGNSASGSGSEVVQLSGTIAVSSTLPAEPAAWEVGTWGPAPDNQEEVDALTVPAGKTLTVAPGAVVKGNVGSTCDKDTQLCAISVEGALDAVGTASEPITFTSVNDNSVGGATGSGSPKPGDWFGIGSSGAEGSVDLEHVNLSYAYTGLDADGGGETVVRDDAFASQDEGAVAISGSGSAPTLEDNTSDGSGEAAGPGVPAYIVHGELNADLLGGNSASGSGSEVVQLWAPSRSARRCRLSPAAWEVGTWGPAPDNRKK